MFHSEQTRLQEALGDRLVRIWRWGWHRRFRFADWLYACALFPWVAMVNLVSLDVPNSGTQWGLLPVGMQESIGQLAWPIQMMLGLLAGLVIPGLASLTVLVRRSRPGWLLAAALALLVIVGNPVAVPLALYSYAVWFTDRRRLAAWTSAMVVGTVVAVTPDGVVGVVIVQSAFLIALPLTVGLWVGTRRLLIANLKERTERLEREQHLEAQRALVAERTRIAREMHDVVAHRVSLMVVHAGGLEVSTADEQAVATAALIRATGREALTELREILGVLRDDAHLSATTTPQPVLADLDDLVGGWREAGMCIELHTLGEKPSMAAQLERTAYRTVQEGITNAAKHASDAAVTVRVVFGSTEVEVSVANEPPPHTPTRTQPPPSSGFGLAGLRERLSLVGAMLTAGPYPDGGWQLRAAIPLTKPRREDNEVDQRPAGG